MFTRLLDIPVR